MFAPKAQHRPAWFLPRRRGRLAAASRRPRRAALPGRREAAESKSSRSRPSRVTPTHDQFDRPLRRVCISSVAPVQTFPPTHARTHQRFSPLSLAPPRFAPSLLPSPRRSPAPARPAPRQDRPTGTRGPDRDWGRARGGRSRLARPRRAPQPQVVGRGQVLLLLLAPAATGGREKDPPQKIFSSAASPPPPAPRPARARAPIRKDSRPTHPTPDNPHHHRDFVCWRETEHARERKNRRRKRPTRLPSL